MRSPRVLPVILLIISDPTSITVAYVYYALLWGNSVEAEPVFAGVGGPGGR